MAAVSVFRRFFPTLVVGAVGGLFGYSIVYQDPLQYAEYQWILVLGAAAIAACSSLLVQLGALATSLAGRALGLAPSSAGSAAPSKQRRAFSFVAVGLLIAIAGYLIAVFVSGELGFFVAFTGLVWGTCAVIWGLVAKP